MRCMRKFNERRKLKPHGGTRQYVPEQISLNLTVASQYTLEKKICQKCVFRASTGNRM